MLIFKENHLIKIKEDMDMDKFVPLPGDLKNSLLEIVSKYNSNETFQPIKVIILNQT